MIDVPIQEICFLELASPSVDEGITKCVERGATKIAVVPILLLTANHANEDIPFEIEVGKIMYPDVEFTYGKAFGIHPKIVDSLYDRVIEQQVPIDEEAQVLLVGRGSSDQAVKRDLTEIAQLLAKKYPFKQVDVCFLYGATLRLMKHWSNYNKRNRGSFYHSLSIILRDFNEWYCKKLTSNLQVTNRLFFVKI